MRCRYIRQWCAALLCLLLFACAAPQSEPVAAAPSVTETPFAETTAAVIVEVTAPTPTPTPSPVPTPEPTPSPTPIPTPTPEPFFPAQLPDGVRPAKGFTTTGTDGVLQNNAEGWYAAYGTVGESEPAFYLSDAEGTVQPGEAPLDRALIVPDYTPIDAPEAEGRRLLVVYLQSQSVVGYIAENGEWIEQRTMICSTGRRNYETPVGEYKIYQRYEYKLLGTEDSPCYGLWACRFRNHYLFHSVPINADAGRDVEKGHRLTDMRKYEKLGSPASAGCIRLTVADAKWIYEFSADETVAVRIIKDIGPTPQKPPVVRWEEPYTNRKGYGWDPTDPHPDNPYLTAPAVS